MEFYELEARESIRDLVARYNANGDAGRIDPLLELFVEDAWIEVVSHRTYRGLVEIRALFEGAASGEGRPDIRFLRHFTATHQIDLSDEHQAHGRCYFVVYTEKGADHWGRYQDEYTNVDGRWLFRSRQVTVDARVPGGWGDRTHAALQSR